MSPNFVMCVHFVWYILFLSFLCKTFMCLVWVVDLCAWLASSPCKHKNCHSYDTFLDFLGHAVSRVQKYCINITRDIVHKCDCVRGNRAFAHFFYMSTGLFLHILKLIGYSFLKKLFARHFRSRKTQLLVPNFRILVRCTQL